MHVFSKIKLIFDIDCIDKKLIDFASNFIKAKEVHLAFIDNLSSDSTDCSSETCENFLDEQEEVVEDIKNYIKAYLGLKDSEVVIKKYNYKQVAQIVKDINEENVDLIVSSNKNTHKEYVSFLKRVLKNCTASILLAPEGFNGKIQFINVGVDFSKYSTNAVEYSYLLAKVFNFQSINLINIYSVPYGYHKLGKTFEEFSKKLEDNISNNFDELISSFKNKKIIANKKIVNSDDISKALDELSGKNALLVIGDKGQNAASSLFLGSVPENILLNSDNPVLMVRMKHPHFRLVEALFGIEN